MVKLEPKLNDMAEELPRLKNSLQEFLQAIQDFGDLGSFTLVAPRTQTRLDTPSASFPSASEASVPSIIGMLLKSKTKNLNKLLSGVLLSQDSGAEASKGRRRRRRRRREDDESTCPVDVMLDAHHELKEVALLVLELREAVEGAEMGKEEMNELRVFVEETTQKVGDTISLVTTMQLEILAMPC